MRGALLVIRWRSVAGWIGVALVTAAPLRAQDTTTTYPWRTSYFPYITATPSEGVLAVGRVVLFQQSRWDARTSIDRQISFDAGYSTANTWLVRARADMPHLADGWRLQAIAQVDRESYLLPGDWALGSGSGALTDRATASLEISRRVVGRVYVAARGEYVHFGEANSGVAPDHDVRGRVALVADLRDREYNTRQGALLQGGVLGGTDGGSYHGFYGMGTFWVPLTATTVLTGRAAYRAVNVPDSVTYAMTAVPADAWRTLPAWEDEFVVGGGFESNRGLPSGALSGSKVTLANAEVRQQIFSFPGGALSVLAFVDGGRSPVDVIYRYHVDLQSQRSVAESAATTYPDDWAVAAGGGVSLRLLRNAILTATVSRADHATRVYVGSGWSW